MTTEQGAEGRTRRRVIITSLSAVVGAVGLYLWHKPSSVSSFVSALVFLACLSATLLLVPHIARWATRRRVLALPGGRDLHRRPTPRAGGIALFLPVAATLLGLALWSSDTRAWGLLIGSSIVFGCGLVDDIKPIRARYKILCQLLAGGALLLTGFHLDQLSVPELGVIQLGWFGIPLVLFWIVLVSNAFNLSDGLDGLASSLTILGLAVLVAAGVPSLVPIALAGTCLGFLYYNMPRARIFLGDSGSLLLGFLLAALALELPVAVNVPVAIAAVAYSLGDVTLAVMRRFVRGKPLFAPDSSHLHHKAVLYAGGVRRGLFVVLVFAGLQAVAGVFWPGFISLTATGLLWLVVALILARLGSYDAAGVLEDRRPMQRLHALQRYISTRISTSRECGEIEQALQHFVEGAGLCAAAIDNLRVINREGCCASPASNGAPHAPLIGSPSATNGSTNGALTQATQRCTQHELPLLHGRAAWRVSPGRHSAAVNRERETVVVTTLRLAHARLRALGGKGLDTLNDALHTNGDGRGAAQADSAEADPVQASPLPPDRQQTREPA